MIWSIIAEHFQNAYKESELDEWVVCRNFRLTTQLNMLM